MSLILRPYQPTDANVIATWLKSEYLMRQWCADRYERFPVTPENMNSYHQQYIDGHNSIALTMVDGEEIVGYITLRTPADDLSEQRLGFVIVDDSKRGKGLGKLLSAWRLIMHSANSKPQKCHWACLKTIRLQYVVMNRLDSIVLAGKKLRVTDVLVKHGIVLKWNTRIILQYA